MRIRRLRRFHPLGHLPHGFGLRLQGRRQLQHGAHDGRCVPAGGFHALRDGGDRDALLFLCDGDLLERAGDALHGAAHLARVLVLGLQMFANRVHHFDGMRVALAQLGVAPLSPAPGQFPESRIVATQRFAPQRPGQSRRIQRRHLCRRTAVRVCIRTKGALDPIPKS